MIPFGEHTRRFLDSIAMLFCTVIYKFLAELALPRMESTSSFAASMLYSYNVSISNTWIPCAGNSMVLFAAIWQYPVNLC